MKRTIKAPKTDVQVIETMQDFYNHPKGKEALKAHDGHDVQLMTGTLPGYCAMYCETCNEDVISSEELQSKVKGG